MAHAVRNTRPTWADNPPSPYGWCNACLVEIGKAGPPANGQAARVPGRAITLVAVAQAARLHGHPQPFVGVVCLPTCFDHLGVRTGSSPIVTA